MKRKERKGYGLSIMVMLVIVLFAGCGKKEIINDTMKEVPGESNSAEEVLKENKEEKSQYEEKEPQNEKEEEPLHIRAEKYVSRP